MGAWRPFFVMVTVHDKEKQLYREITRSVSQGLPGVEVLAVELTGQEPRDPRDVEPRVSCSNECKFLAALLSCHDSLI